MDTAPAPFGGAPSPSSPPPTWGMEPASLPQLRPCPSRSALPRPCAPTSPPTPGLLQAPGAAGTTGARQRAGGRACALAVSPSGDPGRCCSRLGRTRGAGGGRGERLRFQPRVRRRPGLAGGAGGTAPRPEAAAAAAALVRAAASPAPSVITPPAVGNGRKRGGGEKLPPTHRGESWAEHPPSLPASLPPCLPPILSSLPSLPAPQPSRPHPSQHPSLLSPPLFQPFFHPFLPLFQPHFLPTLSFFPVFLSATRPKALLCILSSRLHLSPFPFLHPLPCGRSLACYNCPDSGASRKLGTYTERYTFAQRMPCRSLNYSDSGSSWIEYWDLQGEEVRERIWICAVLGWGWGRLSLKHVANKPPHPFFAVSFFLLGVTYLQYVSH